MVSHSSLNQTHCSLTVILTEPWHQSSCENSNFQNGKLLTFVDSTINGRGWFKCLIRSSQTWSWDGKLTFRNFSVTEQDVIVCFVRINAFHANIDVNDNRQLFVSLLLLTSINFPRDSSIDWNIDNAWAAGEGIISVEVNTTPCPLGSLFIMIKSW
jgi:hypothetical protein